MNYGYKTLANSTKRFNMLSVKISPEISKELPYKMLFTSDADSVETYQGRTQFTKMMRVLMVILAMSGHVCLAEFSRADRMEMIRRDLTAFSEFKYGRYFHIENMTCQYIRQMSEHEDSTKLLSDNLRLLLDSLYDRYYLVKGAVRNTGAKKCLDGLADQYDKLYKQDSGDLDRCINIALMTQSKSEDQLSKVMANYIEDNDNVLYELGTCMDKFPNKKSNEAWERCHKIQYDGFIKNFDKELNDTYRDSPCMANFLSLYLPCFLSRFDRVINTATKLIIKLDHCIAIADLNIPPVEVNLDSTNILPRIKEIQKIYMGINENVSATLLQYYEVEKNILQAHVLSPEYKTEDDFYDELVNEFSDYFKAVNQTMSDNPSDAHYYSCGFDALSTLQQLLNDESEYMGECHDNILESIYNRVELVRNLFSGVMEVFPTVSNMAILNCLTTVYMFGNNTIEECYDLHRRNFELNWEHALEDAKEAAAGVNEAAVGGARACGERGRRQLVLKADHTLFEYRRCLAKATTGSPGPTDYEVTLPSGSKHSNYQNNRPQRQPIAPPPPPTV